MAWWLMININWRLCLLFLAGEVCVQAMTRTDQPRITNLPVNFKQQLKTYFDICPSILNLLSSFKYSKSYIGTKK